MAKARQIGLILEIKASSQSALQADGRSPLKVMGKTKH